MSILFLPIFALLASTIILWLAVYDTRASLKTVRRENQNLLDLVRMDSEVANNRWTRHDKLRAELHALLDKADREEADYQNHLNVRRTGRCSLTR